MNMNTMNKKIKKTSTGRKKIEIKKIEEVNNRQVTFSKRRTGIFKKAAELCVLTGCEVAILVNSPGGHVYAFGHPTPDVTLDRYLNNSNNAEKTTSSRSPPLVIEQFNQYYVEKSMELETVKKQKEMIQESKSMIVDGLPWYHEIYDFDGVEVDELKQYLSALVELRRKVLVRADELQMIRKDPKLSGLNMLSSNTLAPNMLSSNILAPNMLDNGDLGFLNDIPNTMISTNNMDQAYFDFANTHYMDSMM